MKRLLAAVLSCALISASCQKAPTTGANPIAPSRETPAAPAPPLYPPESWALTASVTSATRHPCWRDLTGFTSEQALIVGRGDAMRLVVYWDPTDGIEYVGSLSGQDFSLAGRYNTGNAFNIGCASGGSIGVILTGRVSGRFSDDGRSIAAEEVLSYHIVATGEQIDVRFRWAATAPR